MRSVRSGGCGVGAWAWALQVQLLKTANDNLDFVVADVSLHCLVKLGPRLEATPDALDANLAICCGLWLSVDVRSRRALAN